MTHLDLATSDGACHGPRWMHDPRIFEALDQHQLIVAMLPFLPLENAYRGHTLRVELVIAFKSNAGKYEISIRALKGRSKHLSDLVPCQWVARGVERLILVSQVERPRGVLVCLLLLGVGDGHPDALKNLFVWRRGAWKVKGKDVIDDEHQRTGTWCLEKGYPGRGQLLTLLPVLVASAGLTCLDHDFT